MQCGRCHAVVAAGDAREHLGQTLCEDCYMDALSPARACDPWAVHSAKAFEKSAPGKVDLSAAQKRILDLLARTDGLEATVLAQRLGMTIADLEREIATLRHMERVRGELRGGRRFIRAW